MMCFNGFPICHCLFGFFIWFSNKSRGARPSVITLPNEAMSLKGKQLGTPSCVRADRILTVEHAVHYVVTVSAAEFFYTVSHAWSFTISCQVYWSVFCTYDAFRISNSIRCFWASVCVFFLFCCVVSFVVGWQQHCRSIIIDAMVYPKSWKSEDKSGTGKTLKSMDWVWILTSGYEDFYLQHCMSWRLSWLELREFYFRLWTGESIWVWSLRHWVRVRHRSFGMMSQSHHLSFVLEERRIILWLFLDSSMWPGTMDTFRHFGYGRSCPCWIEHPYNVVRWDAMSKGGVKVDHPMGDL